MGFFVEPWAYDVFKLLDLVPSDFAELFSEFSVFVDEVLDYAHLLVQLVEFGVCQGFGLWKTIIKLCKFAC